jgi:hypothetical protein
VEAGPLLALLEIGLAKVDARVEVVGERLGDGLDALEVDTRGGELRLGRRDVAGLDRGDERLDRGHQCLGLAVDVPLVAVGGLFELALGVDLDRVAGDREVAADAVTDHPGAARRLVGAGLGQLDDQLALQPGGDVLHLAHHPVALAVDVELGDLVAAVGDDEGAGPGRRLGARQLALAVGGLDGDVAGGSAPGVVGALVLGLAAGQRDAGQQGGDGGHAGLRSGEIVHVVDLSDEVSDGRELWGSAGVAAGFVLVTGHRNAVSTTTR